MKNKEATEQFQFSCGTVYYVVQRGSNFRVPESDKILSCDYSNESYYKVVLSSGAVYVGVYKVFLRCWRRLTKFIVHGGLNFLVTRRTPLG